MDALYKLKDLLCDELEEYGKKGELNSGTLEVVDKLSHALKSITTIIAMEEADGDYSGTYGGGNYPRMYYRNGGNGTSYGRGSSYAGRRNARRDSRGRYSRADGYSGAVDDMIEQLQDMMEEAPNEQVKQDIQRLVTKIEKM